MKSCAPIASRRKRRKLPPQAGLANPVDMIASATPAQYARTIELVSADPNIDALIVIYIPPLVTDPTEIAQAIADTGYQGYVAHEFVPIRDPLTSLREAVALCDV